MIEDNIWINYPAQYVIGADEVGRGSFAGPIVACAVKINSYDKEHLIDVKDSKKLTEKKRNSIFEIINNTEISYSISVCDNKQIDMYGIQKSNQAVLINSINKVKTGGEKIYIQTQYNYTERKCPSYPWMCRCCNYVRKTALARRVKIEMKEHKKQWGNGMLGNVPDIYCCPITL